MTRTTNATPATDDREHDAAHIRNLAEAPIAELRTRAKERGIRLSTNRKRHSSLTIATAIVEHDRARADRETERVADQERAVKQNATREALYQIGAGRSIDHLAAEHDLTSFARCRLWDLRTLLDDGRRLRERAIAEGASVKGDVAHGFDSSLRNLGELAVEIKRNREAMQKALLEQTGFLIEYHPAFAADVVLLADSEARQDDAEEMDREQDDAELDTFEAAAAGNEQQHDTHEG